MSLSVREMQLEEVGIVIDYFHTASAEHLNTLGVDPARLPSRTQWHKLYELDFAQPIEQRRGFLVLWQLDGQPIGFSTVDKIEYGRQAFMHLHVLDPNIRNRGHGAACVRQSVEIYFDVLKLDQLFCEPNAFNVAPNRALQKAGFKYIKTHETVPGPLNFHQAVTQWVLPRPKGGVRGQVSNMNFRFQTGPCPPMCDGYAGLVQRIVRSCNTVQVHASN